MMKRISLFLLMVLFAHGVHSQWLPDSILNDRNSVNRTGYNNARGIVTNLNDVYAVWIEAGYRIFLRAKEGGTWSASEEVSVGSPGGIYGTSTYPSIAIQGNEIHVVWEDYRTGDYEIFYRRFSNGWGNPINLTGDTAQSRNAVITVTNSGKRFLAWQDDRSGIYEVYGKVYENGSWGATEKLSNAALFAGFPTMAHHNETVYLVWEEMENDGYELYFCTYTGSWSSPQRITNSQGLSQYPSLCTTPSGTLHLVFADDRYGSFDIFHMEYSGSNWTSESLLTQQSDGEALYPQIAADPFGNLHFAWSGNGEGEYEIYYKKRLSGGQWSGDTLLSSTGALSSLPHLAAATDGSVYLMWYDWVEDPVFTSPHIRYRRYQGSLDLLSSNINTEVTAHGFRMSASIPGSALTLFRIEEPFPVAVDHCHSTDDSVIWYDELAPGDYRYTLQVVNGYTLHYTPVIEVHIPERPRPLLLSLHPNPFHQMTEIRLTGASERGSTGEGEIRIYDLSGRFVRKLDFVPGNSYRATEVSWDGRDRRGKPVSPGVYFVHYRIKDTIITRKVVKL